MAYRVQTTTLADRRPVERDLDEIIDAKLSSIGNDATAGEAAAIAVPLALEAIRDGVDGQRDTLRKAAEGFDAAIGGEALARQEGDAEVISTLRGAVPTNRNDLKKLNDALTGVGNTAASAVTSAAILTDALNYVDTIEGLLASLAAGEPITHIKPGTTFSLGSDVPFLQLDSQKIVSENPAYIPLFQDTLGNRGPDDPMVDIWFRNGELRGNWFGKGMAPTAQNWNDQSDTNTYRRGIFLRSRARQKPGTSAYEDAFGLEIDHLGGQYVGDVIRAVADLAKVYAIHIRELEGHEITQALWHQYGTDGAFTSTYHTVDRARANSQIIRYLADYLKFGDNAGSGGSPGFFLGWAELYRGGRGLYTYSPVKQTAGTNPDSCRKIRIHNGSFRGQIGDSIFLNAGTDIEIHSATTDDSNHGIHIGPNYEGTLKLVFPIAKDARKHGIWNESPTAQITIFEPQVGNNSFSFGSAFAITPAAGGNGTVSGISDTFGDSFEYDGDAVGGDIQNAVAGNWTIVFTSPTAFDVKRPSGTTLGSGTVGSPFVGAGELKLTVVAGSTPFVAGDVITLAVSRANDNRGVYDGICSQYPITIINGVSGVSLSFRSQAGWYGWKANPEGGYFNAKDGDQLRPGTATSLNVFFKTVVTDPKTQIPIGANAFATRKNAVDWLNACRRDPYISAMAWSERPEEGGGEALKIDITAKEWSRAWTDFELGFAPAGVSTDDPTAAPIANRMLRSGGSLSDGTGGSLIDGPSAATQGYGIRAPKDSRITGGPLCAANVFSDMLLF